MTFSMRKIIALYSIVLIAASFVTFKGAEEYFLREMAKDAKTEIVLYKEVIRGWLGRFRPLPSIYAGFSEIQVGLETPTEENIRNVNLLLEAWAAASGASDIYLLDDTGLTIAASNWNETVTFVGQNYAFRPYFQQAMQGRLGRFFALGVISGKRGYYFSYPVRRANRILGVVVVKLNVVDIEQDLRGRENEIIIADDAGVVLMASHPSWRLSMLAPLNEKAIARIEADRQFDIKAMDKIPVLGVKT
ncbi:MAG: sensor histidine kinase, partial [Alphaproteobacteria bacterium]|nr:sensor histidine kinase [Alphaproteobacteria bacterium]